MTRFTPAVFQRRAFLRGFTFCAPWPGHPELVLRFAVERYVSDPVERYAICQAGHALHNPSAAGRDPVVFTHVLSAAGKKDN